MVNSNAISGSMSPHSAPLSHIDMTDSSQSEDAMKAMAAGPATGHMMLADDPDNPQNWPILKKIYASAVAFAFAWTV